MYQEIINAIQTLNASVTGVTKAPLDMAYAEALNPDLDCPYCITFPGGALWDQAAIGQSKDDSTWTVLVLIAPTASGLRPTVLQASVALLDGFREVYLDPYNDLGGLVEYVENVGHEGLRSGLIYAGVDYWFLQIKFTSVLKESRP